MSRWLAVNSPGLSIAQGSTNYQPLIGGATSGTTAEANTQLRARSAYTLRNLAANASAISGTCTLRTRVNGGNGSQSVSITATGLIEDTTNTDSIASGDLMNFQTVMSNSHGNACTLSYEAILIDDAGVGSAILATQGGSNSIAQNFFFAVGAGALASGTESDVQVVFRASTTLSNFRVYVSTNTLNATKTIRTRKNGANGGQSVSYTASQTGEQEDTTGSDSMVAGDLLALESPASGSSGTMVMVRTQIKASAVAQIQAVASIVGSGAQGASTTTYVKFGTSQTNATESNQQVKALVVDVWKNMQALVRANSRSDATTFDMRVNAASPGSGPAISVTAASTGIKEDLTGSYTTATTDLINFRRVTGGGTGTIEVDTTGVQQSDLPTFNQSLIGRPFGARGEALFRQIIAT